MHSKTFEAFILSRSPELRIGVFRLFPNFYISFSKIIFPKFLVAKFQLVAKFHSIDKSTGASRYVDNGIIELGTMALFISSHDARYIFDGTELSDHT
jgi:hypothetical protein